MRLRKRGLMRMHVDEITAAVSEDNIPPVSMLPSDFRRRSLQPPSTILSSQKLAQMHLLGISRRQELSNTLVAGRLDKSHSLSTGSILSIYRLGTPIWDVQFPWDRPPPKPTTAYLFYLIQNNQERKCIAPRLSCSKSFRIQWLCNRSTHLIQSALPERRNFLN
jgi:hypothetical protein